MYPLAPLTQETALVTGTANDLAVDNARADLRRAEYLQAVCHDMTDDELRIVFGGHYDNWTRHYMEHRLSLHVGEKRLALVNAEFIAEHGELEFERRERERMDVQDRLSTAAMVRDEEELSLANGGYTGD